MDTVVRKTLIQDVRDSNLSSMQLRTLQKALKNIEAQPLQELLRTGKAKKMKAALSDDDKHYYLYRVNLRDRLVFSETKGRRIVHELIDGEEVKKLSYHSSSKMQ